MIINKTTKDYYIGSASTGRFYARFCNHVIYFSPLIFFLVISTEITSKKNKGAAPKCFYK